MEEKADSFIGLQLQCTKNGILIRQSKHISKAGKKFEVVAKKRETIPIDTQTPKVAESPIMTDKTLYQSLVGWLNYLSQWTRPDITFATSYLARHLKESRVAHLEQGKKCLAFLRDSHQKGSLFKQTNLQSRDICRFFIWKRKQSKVNLWIRNYD